MMGGAGTMIGGAGVLGMLVPLLFWGGVFGLLAWGFGLLGNGRRRKEVRAVSPEQRLYELYCRGEIGAAEYRRALESLIASRNY